MTKKLMIAMMLVFCSTAAWAESEIEQTYAVSLTFYSGGAKVYAVSAGSSITSQPITINKEVGYFAVQARVQGGGTAKFEVETSPFGNGTFREVCKTNACTAMQDPFLTGILSSTGDAGDGIVNSAVIAVPPGHAVKIKITETSGTASITPTGWFMKH